MPGVPNTGATPLIRTDFADASAWEELVEEARTPSADGFLANLQVISEEEFKSAGAEELGKSAAATDHSVVFIADELTMTHPDRPILCVDVFAPERKFRVIPSELWSVENNLSLANMDFEEFADATGADGIFRGF